MLTEFFLVAFFDVSNVDNGCGGTNGCSRVAGWNGTGEERMEGTGQGGELAAFVIGDDLDDDDIFTVTLVLFFLCFCLRFPFF